MKKIITSISIALLCGCATQLTPQGTMVKRATKEEVKGYAFLGNITTSSPMTGVMAKEGFQNALNQAFNKAAERGATHLVVDPTCEPWYWTGAEIVRAEAYKAK